jgi:hypothetical protein
MDDTYKKHAYKCLPMTSANVHGWELVLQQDVVVQLDSPTSVPRVLSGEKINHTTNGSEYERSVVSQSTIGMVSFDTGWAIQTPEGVSTWITGTPNYFVDGAVPLTASIPTSWWPDPWNMNWKITKLNTPVHFPKGMPFMFFQFYHDDLLPSVEFSKTNAWDNPELMEARSTYGNAKVQKTIDEPWVWMGGIRTGVDEKGNRIGPAYEGHPMLEEPT